MKADHPPTVQDIISDMEFDARSLVDGAYAVQVLAGINTGDGDDEVIWAAGRVLDHATTLMAKWEALRAAYVSETKAKSGPA